MLLKGRSTDTRSFQIRGAFLFKRKDHQLLLGRGEEVLGGVTFLRGIEISREEGGNDRATFLGRLLGKKDRALSGLIVNRLEQKRSDGRVFASSWKKGDLYLAKGRLGREPLKGKAFSRKTV